MGIYFNCKKMPFDMDMGYYHFSILRDKIAQYVPEKPNEGTIKFLEQEDYEGHLTYRECNGLLDDIKNMNDSTQYGYVYCRRTIEDFKKLLAHCYSHRCNLRWS